MVHGWQLQPQSCQMRVAVLFGNAVVNQDEVFPHIVVAINEPICAVLFLNGVTKHLNVARSLVRFPHVFFQDHGARCALFSLDELALGEHLIDRPLMLFIHDDFDRDASHTGEVVKKPQVVFVFFNHSTVDGLNVAVFDSGKHSSNCTGGTTRKP